jgi:hypothetical protein
MSYNGGLKYGFGVAVPSGMVVVVPSGGMVG